MSKRNHIVILGSGESGVGAAILAQRLGYDVFVSDKGALKPPFKAELEQHGISFEEGGHTLDAILKAGLIIKSPGIPRENEIVQAALQRGIPVIGEIEFAWRHAGPCTTVAITGSNGKTTTTELTYHLLKHAGLNVRMAGNVGYSFARYVADDLAAGRTQDKSRVFVLETSSFQLDDIERFRPTIAMLLNITPDHLDRYGYVLGNYVRSKFRIQMNQRRGDVFIYNAENDLMRDYMAENALKPAKKIAVKSGFYKNGVIRIGRKHRFDMRPGKLRGPHNMFNAVCALHAALLLGAAPERLQEALNSFTPPPHRLEVVAVHEGVTWINDSKATNVDSVYYALQAMEQPTVWIVGGQDKGNDYTPLLDLVRQKVKAIVCMGLDNTKILKTFETFGKPMIETRSAEAAVEAAAGFAQAGDTVLLSPACASFDLFKNYEHRGQLFREAVKSHPSEIVSPKSGLRTSDL